MITSISTPFIAEGQRDGQVGLSHARVLGIHVVDLEVEQESLDAAPAADLGNRLVVLVQNGQVDGWVLARLQVHVPVTFEFRIEAEVVLVEVGGRGDRVGHENGIKL